MYRYMLRQLLWPLFFAAIATWGIVWVSQSLRFVDLVLNRGLPAYNMFYLAFLVLPMFTSVLLPVILFGVVVFAYAKMNQDSELVVWRSCGKGPLALAGPALSVGVLVMLICYALNTYYMPLAYREFKDLQSDIRRNYSEVLMREGAFNEFGKDITIFVRERAKSGQLKGLLVYDNRDFTNPVTMMAEEGALVRTPEGPRVVMRKGNRQILKRKEEKLSILYFDQYTLDLGTTSFRSRSRWREPEERYILDLLGYGQDTRQDRRDRSQHKKLVSAGHQRLASPLLAIAFVLLALAALLTGDFNRRGQGWRITVVTGAMVIIQSASLGLHHMAGRSLTLIPALYALPLVVIAASLWLLLWGSTRRRVGGKP